MQVSKNPFENVESIYFFIDNMLFCGEIQSVTVDRDLGLFGISPARAELIIRGVEVGVVPPGAADDAPHFSMKKGMLPEPQRRLPCPVSSE